MEPSVVSGSPSGGSEASRWNCFKSVVPRSEVVFACQVVLVYILVITALANLTLNNGDSKYWLATVSGAVGYLLPNPSIKAEKWRAPNSI
jgi:hypothetical protein